MQRTVVVLAADYDSLLAQIASLREALEHFAQYPLEDFNKESARDAAPLFGANDWQLNVGHIRKARAALKQVTP